MAFPLGALPEGLEGTGHIQLKKKISFTGLRCQVEASRVPENRGGYPLNEGAVKRAPQNLFMNSPSVLS